MKRFVVLDREHNNALFYFDSVVGIHGILRAYKKDMEGIDARGEDAQYSFVNWLKRCRFIHARPVQSIYVHGPDYDAEFELQGDKDD